MLEFLIPIISFLGIFIGILLKKIAKEEVKFGKFGPKYFIWMKRVIIILLILILLYFTNNYLFLAVGIILGLILGIFVTEYLFLSISIIISFTNKNLLLIISTLTFLYGLPYGSILRKTRLKQIIPITVLFFLPFLLLLTNINLNLLIGISTGGLFQYLIRK